MVNERGSDQCAGACTLPQHARDFYVQQIGRIKFTSELLQSKRIHPSHTRRYAALSRSQIKILLAILSWDVVLATSVKLSPRSGILLQKLIKRLSIATGSLFLQQLHCTL